MTRARGLHRDPMPLLRVDRRDASRWRQLPMQPLLHRVHAEGPAARAPASASAKAAEHPDQLVRTAATAHDRTATGSAGPNAWIPVGLVAVHHVHGVKDTGKLLPWSRFWC